VTGAASGGREARATPEVHDLDASGVPIRVRVWEHRAGGLPVLFWHGLNPFGALQLNEAGPALAGIGFTVVSIAAPGMADSPPLRDPTGYRPTRLAGLVTGVADALGVDRFAFIGWSWGASIGVHLTARAPERLRAVVLLDAGHTDIPGDASQTLDAAMDAVAGSPERYQYEDWDPFLEAAREGQPNWRPALEERLRAGMVERDGAVVAASDRRAVAAAWHGLLQEQPSTTFGALGTTAVPMLLVVGSRNDTAAELRRFRTAVPACAIETIDAGHDLLADAPRETVDLVASWLLRATSGHGRAGPEA
jgi:pimeloyl-ACP methyl ester carboxylesterase